MITEDYCSYEISKLLQEKGFNQECFARYADEKCKERYYDDYRESTFIFMGIQDGIVQAINELCLEPIAFGEPDKGGDYRPATFYQRCCLFQAIRDIRFKWDDKNKQLIRLDVYGNIKRIC